MGNFLFNFLKVLLAIIISPILYACIVCFKPQINLYPSNYVSYFFVYGAGAFLVSFLFIYRFENFYSFGQNIINKIFQFAAPVNDFLDKIIPFYALLILAVHAIVASFVKDHSFDPYFLFFAGFASTMHLLITAQEMHDEETVPFKPSYFFTMTVVSILFLSITVLMMDGFSRDFNFPHYLSNVIDQAGKVYMEAVRVLAKRM